MLGSEFVSRLVSSAERDGRAVSITTLNRGNSYWDSAERVSCRVASEITCSRNRCRRVRRLLGSGDSTFDHVVDFSGYKVHQVQVILESVKIRSSYTYISTDSVYDCCDLSDKPTSGLIPEELAVRPDSSRLARRLTKHKKYGNHKLSCEELLAQSQAAPTTLILRLADVVGRRDNTDRFWQYVLWIRIHQQIGCPLQVPRDDRRFSLTCAGDVASLVAESLVSDDGTARRGLVVRNVALRETVTLTELLILMAKEMGIEGPRLESRDAGQCHTYFPSAECGPMDVSRLSADALPEKWQMSSLLRVISESVEFYEQAARGGSNHGGFEDVIKSLAEDLGFTSPAARRMLLGVIGVSYGPASLRPGFVKRFTKKKG